MANINFHQAAGRDDPGAKKRRALNSGFLISIAILSASFLVLFGMKVYRKVVEGKITVVKNQISEEIKNIEDGKISRVADFQERLEEIESEISSRKNPKETLAKIENLIVPGVTLVSYSYDSLKKDLLLEAISDNVQIISKQILSLKNSRYFTDVKVSEANRSEDGKINFTLKSRLTFK